MAYSKQMGGRLTGGAHWELRIQQIVVYAASTGAVSEVSLSASLASFLKSYAYTQQ